jgi:hypothetical protein
MFAGLVAAGRVIEHSCGHAEIPRMPDHQHLAGNTKQVRTAFNEHLKRCVTSKPEAPQSPANDAVKPDSPQSPANARSGKVRLGNGQVSNGQVRSGNERASANVNGGEPGGIKEVLGQFEDLLTPPAAKS